MSFLQEAYFRYHASLEQGKLIRSISRNKAIFGASAPQMMVSRSVGFGFGLRVWGHNLLVNISAVFLQPEQLNIHRMKPCTRFGSFQTGGGWGNTNSHVQWVLGLRILFAGTHSEGFSRNPRLGKALLMK